MDKKLYDKLTDSAKKELDSSTKELYELLIYKAYLIAKRIIRKIKKYLCLIFYLQRINFFQMNI